MSSRMRTAPRAASEETRNQIKAEAQMLFARHGIDAVTVQQIVDAAGQRNNAALYYHFRTKEELIRQMVVDGATVLDARPDVLSPNTETVPRLYRMARSGGRYARTLELLDRARRYAPEIPTKTGVMVGLG